MNKPVSHCSYNIAKLVNVIFMFQISLQQGNLILAVFMDVLLGYVLLQMLPENIGDIRGYLMDVLEVK